MGYSHELNVTECRVSRSHLKFCSRFVHNFVMGTYGFQQALAGRNLCAQTSSRNKEPRHGGGAQVIGMKRQKICNIAAVLICR